MPAPTLGQALRPTPANGAGGFDASQVHVRESSETTALRQRLAAAALTGLLSRAGTTADDALVAQAWRIASAMVDAEPRPHFSPRLPRP